MESSDPIGVMKGRLPAIKVQDLKQICRDQHLAVSGTKQMLINRLSNEIDRLSAAGNSPSLNSLRSAVVKWSGVQLPPLASTYSSTSRTADMPPRINGLSSGGDARTFASRFRPSPFYQIQEPLGRLAEMPRKNDRENSVTITVKLTEQQVATLRSDSSYRILLYCATRIELAGNELHDVSFPAQLEVKVNGEEVKANFKGLKNKAGSTRPADITAFIRKQSAYSNSIVTTYALTQKGFNMGAMLVKRVSVDALVERIKRGRFITKEKVLNDMSKKVDDDDFVVDSTTMSLKDPVSYMRIETPCRSDICTHNQCFDAKCFLQLQEQAPTWNCPICNKVVRFDYLLVDQYFQDILSNTSSSTTEVTVDPRGQWSLVGSKGGQNGTKNDTPEDSEDDLVEIAPPVKRESIGGPVTPFSFAAPTPPRASPLQSNGPRPGQKRKSEVIDLTLSDDEDDQPLRKRQSYNTPNSLPDRGGARVNGYSNYSTTSSNYNGSRTNGLSRGQVNSGGGGSGMNGGSTHTQYDSSYDNDLLNLLTGGGSGSSSGSGSGSGSHGFGQSSRPAHRPSPLSYGSGTGTALAPINLTESPPRRQESITNYLSNPNTNYGLTLPPLGFKYPTSSPLQSPQPLPSGTSTPGTGGGGGSDGVSEQRNFLRGLAHPWKDYRRPPEYD